MSKDDLDDERAVLEVVELSESEDEGFDYKAVEVWCGVVCARSRCVGVGNVGPYAGMLFILFVLYGCMLFARWVLLLYHRTVRKTCVFSTHVCMISWSYLHVLEVVKPSEPEDEGFDY